MIEGVQPLHVIDFAVIAVIVLTLVAVGMLRGRKLRGNIDFSLAGRNVRWPMIGFSIFASNISAEHLRR